jgi:hypothetical protein
MSDHSLSGGEMEVKSIEKVVSSHKRNIKEANAVKKKKGGMINRD